MNRSKLVDALKRAGAAHCLLETPAGGWALVVPRLGARILGAGVDELNAFWVSPSLEGCLEGRDWNAGGQRTWLAPELGPLGFFGTGESDWAVPPELDPGSYRLLEAGRSGARCRGLCRLRSADGTEYRLELERRVEIRDLPEPGPGVRCVVLGIRHSLHNAGDRPIHSRVGLWSILQVPCLPEGNLLLPDLPYRLYFGEMPPSWVRREAGRKPACWSGCAAPPLPRVRIWMGLPPRPPATCCRPTTAPWRAMRPSASWSAMLRPRTWLLAKRGATN